MRKKLIRGLVSSALAATMVISLAACGGNANTASTGKTDSESTSLVFSWWGNQTRNERTQTVIDMYTQANSGVTIDGQFSEYSDYWNKLSTMAAGKNLPDVLQMDYSKILQFVDSSQLLDLTPYVESGALDLSKCDEGVIASGKVDGKLYGVVNGVNAPALIYNKTLLDEAGITVKDNMTTEEFIALSKEVYEKTGYSTNYNYQADQALQYMMRGLGKDLFTDDGTAFACTQEDMEKYFDVYEQGLEEGWHISSAVYSEINLTAVEQDPLVYGTNPKNRSWCAFVWSNQYTAYSNAAPEGTELAMTTWPAEDPKKADYLKPSQFFSISATCKNPDAAVAFLNYIINDIDCNKVLLGERGIPAPSDVSEAIAPLLDENNQKVIKFVKEVVTPNSSTISKPDPSAAPQIYELVRQVREQLCYEKISAAEAAKTVFEEGSALFGK